MSLKNKTILITGGTGSFGKTMMQHLLQQGAAEIRIFSRDEEKQEAMRVEYNQPKLSFYIGDVRDANSVEHAVRGVDHIFHAAALKQVPSCEFFPMQAVQTNVLGSNNVLMAAVTHNVKSVVCLSTDKAVYPINAMGMSKALMEKTAQSIARRLTNDIDTTISIVRYGNVMCSRGSVIPLFIKQIKEGKPITLTDPKMTRFLMPLSASVALVEHAFLHAQSGDICIKKSPAASLDVLVQALKNLFDSRAEVSVIGHRHGEKMYETLAVAAELARATDMGEYFRIPMDSRDLGYSGYVSEGNPSVAGIEDYHSSNTTQLSVEQTEALLKTLPEVMAALG